MSEINNLIKKKNLRRKKGKKKWSSNIDVSNLQDVMEKHNTETRLEQGVKKKIKKQLQNQPLFVIDQQPDQQVNHKLAKDRFKKKQNLIKSKQEIKKVQKIADNLASVQNKNKKQQGNENEYDLWDEKPQKQVEKREKSLEKNQPKKPVINMDDNPNKIATVVLPEGGQSYNPSLQDHQKLIDNVIETEIKKETMKPNISNKMKSKTIKKQKLRKPKSMKEKLLLEAAQQRKAEKEHSQQFFMLKSYTKQLKDQQKKTAEKAQLMQKFKEQEIENNKKGIVKVPKKIGSVRYEMKISDFQLENQIAPNLRQIKSMEDGKSIIRGQFDTIFRKNLIEKTKNIKKIKTKIPKFKFRETVKDEDFIKTLNIQS